MIAHDFADLEQRATKVASALPRPFLRWAGSKQRLLSQIVPELPAGRRTYYEPFLGAGSLFFLLRAKTAVLSDACIPLVDTYRGIRDSPAEVLEFLSHLDVMDSDQYFEVRASTYDSTAERAAQFIYLNRACWNGLYRVNSKGQFNVPYGRPRSPTIIDPANLYACSDALSASEVEIEAGDFESRVDDADSGDFVYFDPPYVTKHNHNGFIDYNESIFSWDDQVRLAACAASLADRGVSVVVSNANHPAVLDLYPTFSAHVLERRSTLANSVAARGRATEVLLTRASEVRK